MATSGNRSTGSLRQKDVGTAAQGYERLTVVVLELRDGHDDGAPGPAKRGELVLEPIH